MQYPLFAITPRSTLTRSGNTYRVLSLSQIELYGYLNGVQKMTETLCKTNDLW